MKQKKMRMEMMRSGKKKQEKMYLSKTTKIIVQSLFISLIFADFVHEKRFLKFMYRHDKKATTNNVCWEIKRSKRSFLNKYRKIFQRNKK
jgi:hypothetical protein